MFPCSRAASPEGGKRAKTARAMNSYERTAEEIRGGAKLSLPLAGGLCAVLGRFFSRKTKLVVVEGFCKLSVYVERKERR